MEHTMPFFLTVAQRIFSNWTALKDGKSLSGAETISYFETDLAVEHDMGSVECAREFCSYMTEVLYINEGLISSEIASVLDDYMDDQFNTEVQDDSIMQVAEELLRFHRYCMEGNESTAKTEFEKLPPLQSWLYSEQPSQPISSQPVKHQSSSSNEDMDIDKNEQENDEWTVVTNRRSK